MNIFNFFAMVLYFIDHFLVPLIFAIAFLVFIWGLFTYFIAGGANDEKQKEGRQLALWGIIGFVLMIAVWGIVNVLINSLGFDTKSRPALPTFGGSAQQQTTGGTLFQGSAVDTGGATGGGAEITVGLGESCAPNPGGPSRVCRATTNSGPVYCNGATNRCEAYSTNTGNTTTGGQGQACGAGNVCSSGLSCVNGTCTSSN